VDPCPFVSCFRNAYDKAEDGMEDRNVDRNMAKIRSEADQEEMHKDEGEDGPLGSRRRMGRGRRRDYHGRRGVGIERRG
jgi:hypothetical protein